MLLILVKSKLFLSVFWSCLKGSLEIVSVCNNIEKFYYFRHFRRYDYTALRDDMSLAERMEGERRIQEDNIQG